MFHSFFYIRNKNKAIGAAAAAVFFLFAAGAGAATRTWTGTTSTDWSTAANWSGSTVPTSGDDVEVDTVTTPPSNYPVINTTTSVTVNKITIKGMATVTLQSGTLTLTELDCQGSGKYLGNGSSNNGTGTTKFIRTANFKTSNNNTSFGKLEIAAGATLTVEPDGGDRSFEVTKDCTNEGTLALMGTNAATVNFSGNVDFSNGTLTGAKWKAVFKGTTAQTCTLKTGENYLFESLECTNTMGLTVNDTTGTLKPTTLKLSSGGKADFNCPVEAVKVECPAGAGNLTFQKTLKVTDKFEDLSGSAVAVKDTATIKELKHSGAGTLTFEKPLTVSDTFEDSSSAGATIKDTANIKTVKHSGAGALAFQKTLTVTEEFDNTSATGAETVIGEATIKKLSHKGNCALTFQKKATVQNQFTDMPTSGALSFNGGADFQFGTEAHFQSTGKLTLKGECKFAGDFKRTGGETDLGKNSSENGTLTTAAANKNITFMGTGAKLTAVDAACSVTAGSGTCTFGDKVKATGSNELTVETTGTAKFEQGVETDSKLTLKCTHTEIKGDNTFMTLNIDNSGSTAATDVKFEGGKTQTIKNTFATPPTPCFKGKDDTNRLTIESTNMTKCKICFTNDVKAECFTHVTIKNADSVDGSGNPKQLDLFQSADNVKDDNFSDPTTEGFFSQSYTWIGATNKNWDTETNWKYTNDMSTPHKAVIGAPNKDKSKCDITIDTQSGGTDLDLENGVGTPMVTAFKLKSLTVNADKRIGLGKCTIETTGSITNNGTIALYGNQTMPVLKSTAALPNQITHGANSTIEYYGNDANAKDVLSTNTSGTSDGNYKNLVVKMTGGRMTFNHPINATMLDASGNADSAQIDLNCSTVTTPGSQHYKGAVKITVDTTLTTTTSSGDITFDNAINGDTANTRTLTVTAKGMQTYTGSVGDSIALKEFTATADDSYIVLKGTKYKTSGKQTFKAKKGVRLMSSANMEWEAGGTDGIKLDETTTDLYIECTTPTVQAALKSKLHCRNFYFSNGKLEVSAKITAEKDFAVWGTNYNAADPRYDDTSNTRFAFWTDKMPYPPPNAAPPMPSPVPAGAYEPKDASNNPLKGASFEMFTSGAAIEVKGNFYINGADLEPTSTLTLTLLDNSSSKPEFNKTNAVTEKQWGIPFAAVFNMKVQNVNATHYVAAAKNGQGVTDNGSNMMWQFDVPEIASAETVYDDVVFVKFTKALENSNGEIKANLEKAATAGTDKAKGGGVWYNGGMLYFDGKAYSDKECTTEIAANADLIASTGFYLKTVSGAAWNTDASGTAAQSASATDANDSTDRKGIHQNVKVDLSFLEGVFTAADGHTMCKNYGVGMESSAAAPAYTQTTDKCAPVLVKVFTGQELHTDPDGTADTTTYAGAQKPYDAHNFIEFRYSEPVDIGTDMTIANKTMDAKQLNIRATSVLGEITNSSSLTVAGLASFASGSVNTGKAGAVDNTVHSLYRKFKPTPSGTDSFQSNRVRVAIAGYVDSVVTVDSKNYYKWQGYIDSATKPSGTVTRIANATIKDAASPQNTLDYQGTTQHALLPLSVNSTDTDLYGEWDTSPPMLSTFKPDRRAGTGFQNTEAVGWAPTGVSGLHRLEFHFFDNSTNPAEWYLRKGWVGTGGNLHKPFSYGADVFGGARPFDTNDARRTAGGIRYSSIYNKNNSFTIHLRLPGVVSLLVSTTGMVKAGAESLVFKPYASVSPSPNPHDKIDGLYASVELVNKTYAFSTVFTVVYDTSGFVTDLAGNRMKTTTTPVFTIDRTPPRFDLTVAAVKDEANTAGAFKELYVVFNKKLNLKTIPYGTALTSDLRLPDLHNVIGKIKDHLRFIDAASPWAEKGGLNVMNVREKFTSDKATGLILELNRPLTLEDIKTTLLQCWVSNTSIDPLTGIQNVYVSYIQDDEGNYMPHQTAHAISDFAVNVVQPVYAYDGRYLNSGAVELTDNFEESLAAYDWNEEQAKLGALVTGQDIFLYAKFNDGSAAPAIGKVRAYFDNVSTLTAESVSENYNKKKSGVMDWRIWLPSMNFSQSVPEFPALTPHNNMIPKTSSLDVVPSSKSHNNVLIFELPYQGVSSMSNAGWTSGDQISFLFGLADGGGTPLMICRNPVLLGTSTPTAPIYDVSAKSPLFALRLKNPSDISSADLWSFKLQKQKSQRGGVTILNNVINASTGEKTTLQVDMPSAGRLDVIIMTLDGDIVQYLQHGQAESGTHYFTWDGTTKSGKSVARGLYFVRIFGSGIDETRKVMVVKE